MHGARVVYASSAAVYGDGPAPMIETQTPRPKNPYAESKLAGDQLAEQSAKKDDIPVIGLRYFNVYGPGEQHKGNAASMIWQLACQMCSGRRPRVFKWGEQTRDQIYVADVVRANRLAADCATSGVINVGTGVNVSFNEIICKLNEVLNTSFEPEFFENPFRFFQEKTLADTNRADDVLGFRTEYGLFRGITDYFSSVNVKEFVA